VNDLSWKSWRSWKSLSLRS